MYIIMSISKSLNYQATVYGLDAVEFEADGLEVRPRQSSAEIHSGRMGEGSVHRIHNQNLLLIRIGQQSTTCTCTCTVVTCTCTRTFCIIMVYDFIQQRQICILFLDNFHAD